MSATYQLDDFYICYPQDSHLSSEVRRTMARLTQAQLSHQDNRTHDSTKGRSIYKDWKTLELSGETQEYTEAWKASLFRAGVYSDKNTADENDEDTTGAINMRSISPQLQRQVETIRNLVESYMKIVTRTCRDIVPKTIMLLMINSIKLYASLCPSTLNLPLLNAL